MYSVQQAATGEIQTHPKDKENCMACEIHMLNSHHTLFIQEKLSETSSVNWLRFIQMWYRWHTFPIVVTGKLLGSAKASQGEERFLFSTLSLFFPFFF